MMSSAITRKEAQAQGLPHYFTGKPCPNGHIDVRYVTSYACKSCAIEHHQRYRKYEEFQQKEANYKAGYRKKHGEKNRDYAKWYWRNHPNAKANNQASKARNRDAINERQRAANHTPEQAEKAKIHRRRMYLKFRDDCIARAKDRRGVIKGAEGRFRKSDIELILRLQHEKCAECRCSLKNGYHVDHIMPLSLGGSNWPKNLQCLCPSCNMQKHAKHPLDWAKLNGRLL